MERYSDRAIEIINELHRERLDYQSEYLPLIDAANKLSAYEDKGLEPEQVMQTIDPESLRPTAHWECLGEAEALQLGSKYAASYCSRCRGRVRCRSDYCPHCGAKMEDREE